jgi:hypothetical protein
MTVTISSVLIKAAATKAARIKVAAIKAVWVKTFWIKAAAIAGAVHALPGPGASAPGRALGVAALITWFLDAASGGYMIGTWIRRGGPRERIAAGDRMAPTLVFGHFGLASTGLLLWASYVITLAPAVAWVAVSLLVLVIGLGISTVTLWTPFPGQPEAADDQPASAASGGGSAETSQGDGPATGPAWNSLTGGLTDDLLQQALTDDELLNSLVENVVASVPAGSSIPDDARQQRDRAHRRVQIMALIPAGHGVAAMATVLLAVLAAVTAAS